ncbi:MAG: nitroreductase family deazaflavin-dependent oxidoreductase [Deltaproteobacteria bacterium]|nr:nitroreductase family deazaflavin-dependent oxidoreductase [Deltaproteobacteria bacterium]MBW2393740.1 nitroreductase family deazaflavin-dependent oxidoreductase [Deltaproteobacteria bacterium]
MTLRKLRDTGPPQGWARRFYRAPIFFYRVGLGGLLGKRFLLLHHMGRRSGLSRQAVLEVMRHDPATDSCVIASGFGEQADWFRNLMETPDARIELGWKKIDIRAERLPLDEAEREMVNYGQRNPRAAKLVAKLMGYEHDGSDEDLRALAEILPLIRLQPLGVGPHETASA